MTDEEFNAEIDAIIRGLPITMVVSRLALLVRALVESGGKPAADLLRMVVTMRGQIDGATGDTGPQGDPDGGAAL